LYSRDDYINSTDLVDKLLAALSLVACYYKLTKNCSALVANAMTSYDIYNEAKKKIELKKDIEAK